MYLGITLALQRAGSAVTAGGSLVAILESNIAVHYVQYNGALLSHFSF